MIVGGWSARQRVDGEGVERNRFPAILAEMLIEPGKERFGVGEGFAGERQGGGEDRFFVLRIFRKIGTEQVKRSQRPFLRVRGRGFADQAEELSHAKPPVSAGKLLDRSDGLEFQSLQACHPGLDFRDSIFGRFAQRKFVQNGGENFGSTRLRKIRFVGAAQHRQV